MTRNGRLPVLVFAALSLSLTLARADDAGKPFEPITPPAWVEGVTRMAFLSRGHLDAAAEAGVQVVQTNLVWPYYPLRKDGGGLSAADDRALKELVGACHAKGMKLVLGLPPFPSASNVRAHPDWRVHADEKGSILKVEPKDDDLGTRIGCNNGPWGDYLIDLTTELMTDYGLDGYSFDGNYHPGLCYCPACKRTYRKTAGADLPGKIDLDDLAYRKYLVWRGERLEDHYRRMQAQWKATKPDAVLMTWTVNAGRYGQLLSSPRSMPTRLNLLIDLPMQEWWLDETNQGASVAPAFGAAYLAGIMGGRPNGSEPYLMSRGNPYGTDSFPKHERIVRTLLALTQGSIAPQSFGWPGHLESTRAAFRAADERTRWTIGARPLPWAALLVSEQTRQFVGYRDIPNRFLPHVYGGFRAAIEGHKAFDLVNDWDLEPSALARYRVLVLPGSAALSDRQAAAVRAYVKAGGGLVATCEASLCDELGRPRPDFALADVFGVSFRGKALNDPARPAVLAEPYWNARSGLARLTWSDHPLTDDAKLTDLVPQRTVTFRGPRVVVSTPNDAASVAVGMTIEGDDRTVHPAVVARRFGKGRVVYFAAGIDAALWSYAYPYERRLMLRALDWAAGAPQPVTVEAPMAVQASFYQQADDLGRRIVVHLFNGIDSTAHHGQPGTEVPLREESIPVHGIRVRFRGTLPKRVHVEPGGLVPETQRDGDALIVDVPPVAIHSLVVGEL